jgi:hypothetical protein
MSRYADFACIDCKVHFWLGKTIFREDDSIAYFHIGGSKQPLNSQRPELNGTIWKMLADHAGHHLRVVVEDNPDAALLDDDDFVEIGGPGSIVSFEKYLENWEELALLQREREGISPKRGEQKINHFADLVCIDCKVHLWLGKTTFRKDNSIAYFKVGGPEDPPNSQRPELNRSIWKMFADHAGHHLRVVPDAALLDDDNVIRIGEPGAAISFEEYLEGWEG